MIFTRKAILAALFVANAFIAGAQTVGYYQGLDRKYRKYFVGVSYGVGDAHWVSNLGSTELYDKNGNVIRSGDIVFRAQNSTSIINMEIAAPVAKVRIGLGISFENFYLDKITLKSNTPSADGTVIVFDENFSIQKFYLHLEAPFNYTTPKNYSFSFKGNLGYLGISGVKHYNFFGDERAAHTFFVNVGLIGDYKILSHSYFFINPSFEYKYFSNSTEDSPGDITHNIYSFNIVAGLRFDVSRE